MACPCCRSSSPFCLFYFIYDCIIFITLFAAVPEIPVVVIIVVLFNARMNASTRLPQGMGRTWLITVTGNVI